MHAGHDMQFGAAAVGDFAANQGFWDDTNDFAARCKAGIGDSAHQPKATAAINQPNPTRGQFAANHLCAFDINRGGRGG